VDVSKVNAHRVLKQKLDKVTNVLAVAVAVNLQALTSD